MNIIDFGFVFDLVCALVFIIAVPLLLIFVFGPSITKGIQEIQDQRDGMTTSRKKLPRWLQFLNQKFRGKNKCPRCEFINGADEQYCIKCGTRLILQIN